MYTLYGKLKLIRNVNKNDVFITKMKLQPRKTLFQFNSLTIFNINLFRFIMIKHEIIRTFEFI